MMPLTFVLRNGASPLAVAGTMTNGIVLAKWWNNGSSQYVVWQYYRQEEADQMECIHGDYFRDSEAAKADAKFKARVKQFLRID